MYPFIKPGDRLVVKKAPAFSLEVGDIPVVSVKDNYMIHRLVKIFPSGKFLLKGDSMPSTDTEPIGFSNISGKVVAILRKDRFIPLTSGPRFILRKLYALLSVKGLTAGAIRLKVKRFFIKRFLVNNQKDLNRERLFILSSLSGRTPRSYPDSYIKWARLLELASREGLAGVLYSHVKNKDIPKPYKTHLRESYNTIAAANLIRISALESLEKTLKDERIEVLTLKGASLLDNVYTGLGKRPMDDIDLMVRPEDRKKLANILYRMGYRKHTMVTHLFFKEGVEIDLHTDALNIDRIPKRSLLFPLGMEPVWKESIPWKKKFQSIKRPDPVDNIILLSHHIMKHSFARLIWLVDILELLKTYNYRIWEKLNSRSIYLSQNRHLRYTFFLLQGLFGYNPPSGSGFENPAAELTRLERGILMEKIKGGSLDRVGPLMTLYSIRGTREQIAFLWENIFPEIKAVKGEAGRLSEGKAMLYHARRLVQILLHSFRQFRLILSALVWGSHE